MAALPVYVLWAVDGESNACHFPFPVALIFGLYCPRIRLSSNCTLLKQNVRGHGTFVYFIRVGVVVYLSRVYVWKYTIYLGKGASKTEICVIARETTTINNSPRSVCHVFIHSFPLDMICLNFSDSSTNFVPIFIYQYTGARGIESVIHRCEFVCFSFLRERAKRYKFPEKWAKTSIYVPLRFC